MRAEALISTTFSQIQTNSSRESDYQNEAAGQLRDAADRWGQNPTSFFECFTPDGCPDKGRIRLSTL
jgi:hypothetical protein